jgi:hypothetical protein
MPKTTDQPTGSAVEFSMFVAAWGRDTFTPNIFSTHKNANCTHHPSSRHAL